MEEWEDEGSSAQSTERCASFFEAKVKAYLVAKAGAWQRYTASVSWEALQRFVENAATTQLLFHADPTATDFIASTILPQHVQHRSLCFIKLRRLALQPDLLESLVLVTELLPGKLASQLDSLLASVFLPLLHSAASRGWTGPAGAADQVAGQPPRVFARALEEAAASAVQRGDVARAARGRGALGAKGAEGGEAEGVDPSCTSDPTSRLRVPGIVCSGGEGEACQPTPAQVLALHQALETWSQQLDWALDWGKDGAEESDEKETLALDRKPSALDHPGLALPARPSPTPVLLSSDPGRDLDAALTEPEHWRRRAESLAALASNLSEPRLVRALAMVPVGPEKERFLRRRGEALRAAADAREVRRVLRPSTKYLGLLSDGQGDPRDLLRAACRPLLQCLGLAWRHSPALARQRGVLNRVLRGASRAVLAAAGAQLPGSPLREPEAQPALERVRDGLLLLGAWKGALLERAVEGGVWGAACARAALGMDEVLARCQDLAALFQSFVRLQRLERIEIGGDRSQELTSWARSIYAEFCQALESCPSGGEELLHLSPGAYRRRHASLQACQQGLERRLAGIVSQVVQGCAGIEELAHAVEGFEGLLDIPAAAAEIEGAALHVISLFHEEAHAVETLLDAAEASPPAPTSSGIPPMAARVLELRALSQRVASAQTSLRALLPPPLLRAREGAGAERRCSDLSRRLREEEARLLDGWSAQVLSARLGSLDRAALRRSGDAFALALDPDVLALAQETAALLLVPDLAAPLAEPARALNSRGPAIRAASAALSGAAAAWNALQGSLAPQERGVLGRELEAAEKALQSCATELRWRDEGLEPRALEAAGRVRALSELADGLRALSAQAVALGPAWGAPEGLGVPGGAKPEGAAQAQRRMLRQAPPLAQVAAQVAAQAEARQHAAQEDGAKARETLAACAALLPERSNTPGWPAYADMVQEALVEAVAERVVGAGAALLDGLEGRGGQVAAGDGGVAEMAHDKENRAPAVEPRRSEQHQLQKNEQTPASEAALAQPMLAVEVALRGGQAACTPALAGPTPDALPAVVRAWLGGVVQVAACLPRVGADAEAQRARKGESSAKGGSSSEESREEEVAGKQPPSTLPTLESLFPVVNAHPRVEDLRERCEAVLGGLQEQAARELGRWEEFLALAGDGDRGVGTPRETSSPRTSQSLREEAQATVETLERLREAQARLQAMDAAVQVGGILLECRALKQALLTAGTKKTYALLRKLQGLLMSQGLSTRAFMSAATLGLDAVALEGGPRGGPADLSAYPSARPSPGASRRPSALSARSAPSLRSARPALGGGGLSPIPSRGPSAREAGEAGRGAPPDASESRRGSEASSHHVPSRRSSKPASEELGELSAEPSRARDRPASGQPSARALGPAPPVGQDRLKSALTALRDIRERSADMERAFEQLAAHAALLSTLGASPDAELETLVEALPQEWRAMLKRAARRRGDMASLLAAEMAVMRHGVAAAAGNVARFRAHLQSGAPRAPPGGESLALAHVERALDELRKLKGGEEAGEGLTLANLRIEMEALKERHSLLGVPFAENPEMQLCVQELSLLSQAWETAQRVLSQFAAWEAQPWGSADVADLLEATRAAHKEVRSLPSGARSLGVSRQLEEAVKARLAALPVVAELRHPAFSQEHWSRLFAAIGRPDRAVGPELALGALLALELAQHADACLDAVGQAQKEAATQAGLRKIENAWRDWTLVFARVAGQGSGIPLLQPDPLLAEALESDQVVLQGMATSAHVARNPRVLEVVVGWQTRLGSVDAVLAAWRDVQQRWQALESIFTGSADIRQRLPEDTARFESTHVEFATLQEESVARAGVLDACLQPGMAPRLDSLLRSLEVCSKSLQAYLETKRLAFPRFYFVSPAELLDILAKGHDPRAIARYLPKIFESVACLEFAQPGDEGEPAEKAEDERSRGALGKSLTAASASSARLHAAPKSPLSPARPARSLAPSETARASFRASLKLSARGPSPLPPAAPASHETLYAMAMLSPDGERIAFEPPCPCGGPPEVWLARVAESMRASLRAEYREAMGCYDEASRSAWVLQRAQQTAMVASRTAFTREVHDAFDALEEGNEGALKDLFARQCTQLGRLVDLINGELAPAQRRRLIALCTVDVHARDVVQGLVAQRAESAQSFRWQSQLRYYQDARTGDCRAAICDADVPYGYEFTGDSGCLCITPLTDRCYITLTQAQRLHLGGAPAGPAGTGKTETVKDLARALGQLCYVFNCSDQLDFRAMGQIYKGLAQTGAWGCFDEFNRIPVSVLSVCSTQYKAILDALRSKRTTFELDGELFPLKPSVMAFITMNPGYPGRAELPESLKALFRPVSMAAPDLELICEIMLMAEGFQQATTLAHKFITLYRLCESLLSQSRHYDWKLRAIKTTLYVAGGLKRANPALTEEQVLCRALRDFNLGKLTSEDAGIFAGLLQDIFPGLPGTLPPSRNEVFEHCIVSAAQELGLCPEEGFRLKVRQLREILAVRWSVFVLGAAGTGKSCVWRTLLRAQQLFGERSIARVVNPKAVSHNELYGHVSPQTRDWQEGVVSSIFRDMAQSTSHAHQWIVLDGDIDAEWIESMNTVMDDNRLLTLASNERIPLAPSMRLILEIDHMRHCSPATVTRGGVVHLNAADVGWRPPLDAWIAKLPAPELRPLMAALAEKYVALALDRVGPKPGAPGVSAMGHIHALCRLLDAVLPATGGGLGGRREGGGSDAPPPRAEDQGSAPPAPPSQSAPAPGPDRRLTEHHFVWACVWAFGGALSGDARVQFGEWWQAQFRSVPFPSEGSVYEYRVGAAGFERWPADEDGVAVAELGECGGEAIAAHLASSDAAPPTCPDAAHLPPSSAAHLPPSSAAHLPPSSATHLPPSDAAPPTHSSSALVLTRELAQLRHVARLLLLRGSNVLLVGPTASGKSALLSSLAASLQDRLAVKLAALHAEHDAASLQALLESALEKRAGSRYGAPRGRRALFVLDDLGLPAKDAYDTPCALELLRQAVEQSAWYDRQRVNLRELEGAVWAGALNPETGCGGVPPRLQRHFVTLAVPAPRGEALAVIWGRLFRAALHAAGVLAGVLKRSGLAGVAQSAGAAAADPEPLAPLQAPTPRLPSHRDKTSKASVRGAMSAAPAPLQTLPSLASPSSTPLPSWTQAQASLQAMERATLELLRRSLEAFPPSAAAPQNAFNLRTLVGLATGLARFPRRAAGDPATLARLWLHECRRVWADRLCSEEDGEAYERALRAALAGAGAVLRGLLAEGGGAGEEEEAGRKGARPGHGVEHEPGNKSLKPGPTSIMVPSDQNSHPWLAFAAQDEDEEEAPEHPPLDASHPGATPALPPTVTAGTSPAASTPGGSRAAEHALAHPPLRELGTAAELRARVARAQADYDETHGAPLGLVLFPQLCAHVARIARALTQPGGHCLLVGLGGSGRRSAARLAAHGAGLELVEPGAGAAVPALPELRAALLRCLWRAGAKRQPTAVLLPERALLPPGHLALLSDALQGDFGGVPSADERAALAEAGAAEVKARGGEPTGEAGWEAVQRNASALLHFVLCLSPSSQAFARSLRSFPALLSCTTLDWFRAWDRDALLAVARRELQGVADETEGEEEEEEDREVTIPGFGLPPPSAASARPRRSMFEVPLEVHPSAAKSPSASARVPPSAAASPTRASARVHARSPDPPPVSLHHAAAGASARHPRRATPLSCAPPRQQQEHQRVEQLAGAAALAHAAACEASLRTGRPPPTPRSFLEFVRQLRSLLARRRADLSRAHARLRSGVARIEEASAAVGQLQGELEVERGVVETKRAATAVLIESMGVQKLGADEAVAQAAEEEAEAQALREEVARFQAECAGELEAAEPVIREAEAALNSLDKASLGELKSFGSPAQEVVAVVGAVLVLASPGGAAVRDLSWAAGKRFMGNVDAFLRALVNLNKEALAAAAVERVEREFLAQPGFTPAAIRAKSSAAAGLCAWVINICKFFRIYQVVAPKRAALAAANARLEAATAKLDAVREAVAELGARVAGLEADLLRATEEKNAAVAQAEATAERAALATRLLSGLGGEAVRWRASVAALEGLQSQLLGDTALAASWAAYAGAFDASSRAELVLRWREAVQSQGLGLSADARPVALLSSPADAATWAKQRLPGDPQSLGNACIVSASLRWPLLVDPQLQGASWVAAREGPGLAVVAHASAQLLQTVARCVEEGRALLVQGVEEELDPGLEALAERRYVQRGGQKTVKIGSIDVVVHPSFSLTLQSKAAGLGFVPELMACTTVVDFTVTSAGIEEQLLDMVVGQERPDLKESSEALAAALSEGTLQLQQLEDGLLAKLESCAGAMLDAGLVASLERTKYTAEEIAARMAAARETEVSLRAACEVYRPVAVRCTLLYLLQDSLRHLDRVYRFSLARFVAVMQRALQQTPGGADESNVPLHLRCHAQVDTQHRVSLLAQHASLALFRHLAQSMSEEHKLVAAAHLCMSVLREKKELSRAKAAYLMTGRLGRADREESGEEGLGVGAAGGTAAAAGSRPAPTSDWITPEHWAAVLMLQQLPGFASLPDDVAGNLKRWKEWAEAEAPEELPPPGDWKRASDVDRLLLVRALRADRLAAALAAFVARALGSEYVSSLPFDLERSMLDCSAAVPVLVLLSPGLDVVAAVEAAGRRAGVSLENGRLTSVSMGQGQEAVAWTRLQAALACGGWVLLQNIHLMLDWTASTLAKFVDGLGEKAHPEFRLILSAEPPPALEKPLFVPLLQACIKLRNEPPNGLCTNIIRAYSNFSNDLLDSCSKPSEFKTLAFALCFFHATVLERKKFGVGNLPTSLSGIGWNMHYPFSTGDLICCAHLICNYLDTWTRIPWEDLRYMIGEIMYGGHIVEAWDRRQARAYLEQILRPSLLDGAELCAGLPPPHAGLAQSQVVEWLQGLRLAEGPAAFGLHPNAAVGFRLREAAGLLASLSSMQQDSGSYGGAAPSSTALPSPAKGASPAEGDEALAQVWEALPQPVEEAELRAAAEELDPFVMLALQEVAALNALLGAARGALEQLRAALRGDVSYTAELVALRRALAAQSVPQAWLARTWPSLRGLQGWLDRLARAADQLASWARGAQLPPSLWLPGLFNPGAFLTAVLQSTARRMDWALDKTALIVEVTRRTPEQVTDTSREGAYFHGLFMEGARWDEKVGQLEECRPKELVCRMPVMLAKAVHIDKLDVRSCYECPVYATAKRFRQELFTVHLPTRQSWIKWTVAGVCLLVEEP